MTHTRLIFLKLGGSLITDKTQPMTPRPDTLQRLAREISVVVGAQPNLRLLIGHGSGSCGHEVADRYQTQLGGEGSEYWQGFYEVWSAARALNQIVMDAFTHAGLPVIAFPPSAGVISQNRHIIQWDTRPIALALSHGLIPVVNGDVIFDIKLGGTILSTEALFLHLARVFQPQRILIAGLEAGVYRHPQQPQDIIPLITPENLHEFLPSLAPSSAVDVTGGMLAKVKSMLSLVAELPGLEVHIFSGVQPGNLRKALSGAGEPSGTLIANQTGYKSQIAG
jgi:isopentenyl phosphate kinase